MQCEETQDKVVCNTWKKKFNAKTQIGVGDVRLAEYAKTDGN